MTRYRRTRWVSKARNVDMADAYTSANTASWPSPKPTICGIMSSWRICRRARSRTSASIPAALLPSRCETS